MKLIFTSESEGAGGFTLVETLVALAILSLISLFIFMGLRSGTSLWSAYTNASNTSADVTVTQTLLRDILEGTYPSINRSAEANGNLNFWGETTSVSLETRLPRNMTRGGFYKVDISGSIDRQLTITWNDAQGLPSRETAPRGKKTVLLEPLSDLRFDYFGTKKEGGMARWWSSWADEPRLPSLIRIHVALRDKQNLWPDLIVAPKLTADATCVYDALTYGCRGR